MSKIVFNRYALSLGAAAAVLAGCGGSQPLIDAPGNVPQAHVAYGASVAFVKRLETEPFPAFTFSPVAISVYQLGNFGTARKKLEYWSFAP